MARNRKISALEALFAQLFRIVAGTDYLINVHWSAKSNSHIRPLRPSLIRLVFGAMCLLVLGIGLLGFETGRRILQEASYRISQSLHSEYLENLKEIQDHHASLENSLDTVFQQEKKLRALYGVNHLDGAASAYGIGGRTHPTRQDSSLSEALYETLFQSTQKSRQLKGKLEFTLNNLQQISEFVAYRHNLWDHTPSVAPAKGQWTSGFGFRIHPITGEFALHEGLDIAGSQWTPVYATADGVVGVSESGTTSGKYVVLDHGNGFQTRYDHLNQAIVEKGQLVKRYALLGYMGNTGRSTGVHLHYEVTRDGNPVNPSRFILPSGLLVD